MTKYGGDPSKFQLRDMNRRLTSAEKALDRANTRIRNLQAIISEVLAMFESD